MRFLRPCLSLPAMVLVLLAAGAMTGPAEAQTVCVGKESVLLRAGPSWRQDPVGSLAAGTCGVEIVSKCQSGWCEVAHGERRGWVESRLVSAQSGARAPAPAPRQAAPPPVREAAPARPSASPRPAPPSQDAGAERETHCVMGVRPGDTLRIRNGPSAEHREIGGIPPNACDVTVGGPCRGSWCPVTYRGLKGWSNATYLRPLWMR